MFKAKKQRVPYKLKDKPSMPKPGKKDKRLGTKKSKKSAEK